MRTASQTEKFLKLGVMLKMPEKKASINQIKDRDHLTRSKMGDFSTNSTNSTLSMIY